MPIPRPCSLIFAQRRAGRNWPKRFKNPNSGFDLVIVRDMWLTGFDAPSLHTLYIDKPMRGHGADAGDRARQPRVGRQAGRP